MSGRSALTDHAKGKKHTEVIYRRKTFLNQSLPHPQRLALLDHPNQLQPQIKRSKKMNSVHWAISFLKQT